MLLVFVDETSDSKYADYFGLCIAVVNAAHYGRIKAPFQTLLSKEGWDLDVEFKGSYLFSASKGCKEVPVEKRVEIASRVLDLTVSAKNTRVKFYFVRTNTKDSKSTYLSVLPSLLAKALPMASRKRDKNILSLHCDQRGDITARQVRDAVSSVIAGRGYTLLEDIGTSTSSCHTVGIIYADLVGYLIGRIDTISNDSELFDNISPEDYARSGQLRKLQSSQELIGKVRSLEQFVVRNSRKDKG